ncbi:MAG: hypothetical protein AAF236_15605 [Verrucomicrobiota bacterium]
MSRLPLDARIRKIRQAIRAQQPLAKRIEVIRARKGALDQSGRDQ